jgi:hypothetical protein
MGGAVPLVNGVASVSSQSYGIGILNFTAEYGGDANNLSSQSATPANIVFTGSTAVTVTGQTGTLQHAANINVTLQ